MKYRPIILIILLLFFTGGCTYHQYLINLGKEALYQGDLKKAEEIFMDLRNYAPTSYQSYLYTGFIYLYRGEPEKAIKDFEKSLGYNKEPELEYLGLGHAYLALKKYDIAREYLKKARNIENYPVTDYLLGFIYLKEDNNNEAKISLNSASKYYPERGEIWAALGKLSLENLQILDAVQAYQMAYVLGLRTYDVYLGLAESYFYLGNSRQAAAVAEQALTEIHLKPDEKEKLRIKLAQYNIEQNPSKAIESLEAILKNNPDKPEVQLMLGQLYFQQESYQKTIEIFGKYLRNFTPLAHVLYVMYKSHLALNNEKLAEKYLLDAIKLRPEKFSYYLDLLNLYHDNKRLKDTIPVYMKALELDSDNLDLITNLCSVFIELEDYENALTYIKRAIELNSKNLDFYFTKANLHFKLNQIDAEKTTYEDILALSPKNLLAMNNLAQLLRDTNKLDEAFDLYLKASTINPNDSSFYRNLGYILILKNDFINARQWLEKAVATNPEDYQSYRFLGDSYYANDQYNEAAGAYQKSLEIKPDYYYAMYPLGKAYFYLNQLDDARKYFEAYLKRYPYNDGSKFYLKRIQWLKGQNDLNITFDPAEQP